MSELVVVDRSGNQLKVYEREYRERIPGTELERKQVAYEMSSGERVQVLDEDTFISATTGALFKRIDR